MCRRLHPAQAQYQAKDYKNALTSFSQAKDVTSLYNLGNTYAQLGQYEKAIETYKKVLLQDKDNLDAKKNLDLLEKMQQKQQAQSYLMVVVLAMPHKVIHTLQITLVLLMPNQSHNCLLKIAKHYLGQYKWHKKN